MVDCQDYLTEIPCSQALKIAKIPAFSWGSAVCGEVKPGWFRQTPAQGCFSRPGRGDQSVARGRWSADGAEATQGFQAAAWGAP
jgi:hypothetical protein